MKVKVKMAVIAVLWGLYGLLYKIYYPVFTNTQALKQFEDSVRSFTNYALYSQIWDEAWKVLIVITVLTFSKEIFQSIKNRG